MQNFHDLLQYLVEHGQYKPNRTGVGTFASVGHMLQYDLAQICPVPTTKKFAFKSMVGELLGFFRAYDNAADFRALGCKIWDQNANETPAWLANPNRKGTDDLGRIYGVQWTKWRDTRFAATRKEAKALRDKGYKLKAFDIAAFLGLSKRVPFVYERHVNQLEEALRTLIKDPFSRRIVVSGWRPDEADLQALLPCHVCYQWVLTPDGKLHGTLWQRSFDTFLAFNISTLALFTHIMARLSGYEPGTVTMFITDAHVYENHVDQVREQLSRDHYPAPKLVLSDRIQKVQSEEGIKGAFERIQPEDIWLEGYVSHPAIKAPMAA